MKYFRHKSALIINHNGIGNGIMILPILGALETVLGDFHYFHTYNEAINSTYLRGLAGVKNFDGFVPVIWRRFSLQDWERILGFMTKMNVSLLINLRLQQRDLDHHYFQFKNLASKTGIECWDLYECGFEIFNKPIASTIVDMFCQRGVKLRSINWSWLDVLTRQRVTQKESATVAIYLGANQPIKRWFENHWTLLIRGLLAETGYPLRFFPGRTLEEEKYAWRIFQGVHAEWPYRTIWLSKLSLEEFVLALSKSYLIITHDTFASHLAAALGIPAFVLFLATNGHIWRPISNHYFKSLQSYISLNCDQMKVDGTCNRFYGSCHQFCSEGVEPEKAYKEITNYLKNDRIFWATSSVHNLSHKIIDSSYFNGTTRESH